LSNDDRKASVVHPAPRRSDRGHRTTAGSAAACIVRDAHRQSAGPWKIASRRRRIKSGRPEAASWGGHSRRLEAGRTPQDPGDAADLAPRRAI